jgi:HAD superfamily hydrolase (TIGR01484 family)
LSARDLTECRFLLATDMDGTVIPTEPTRARLEETRAFAATVESRREIAIAYITGRHLALACEGIATYGLPRPDHLVCDVGTSVYRRSDSGFALDSAYRELMIEAFGGATGDSIRREVGDVDGLQLQEPPKQSEFKVSYYFPAGERGEEVVERVRRRAMVSGTRVAIVTSHEPGTGRGLLDILPQGVAKDFAVRYLQRLIGLDEKHVVVAGDSGNDRALLMSGYAAIVVSNAPNSLKAEVRDAARRARGENRIYLARQPFAAGVLEGCRHFGLVRDE